jgi:ABC-type oligopeptide transport system substrate-binding subunit
MKKLFAVCLAATLMSSLAACGPSAEEQAKKEEELRKQMDSLFNKAANDMNSAMDSMNTATPADTGSHAGHNH